MTLGDTAFETEGEYWRWDNMGVELEVAEFLRALVRVVKPSEVLETGTGRGFASWYVADGLRRNNKGHLHTFEPLSGFADEARARLAGLPVTVHTGDSRSYSGTPDLVFLDSGPDFRPAEIERWLSVQVPLVIHDSHRYDLPGGVSFPTGRGLWLRL